MGRGQWEIGWRGQEVHKADELNRGAGGWEGAGASGCGLEPTGIGRLGDQMGWHSVKPDGGLLSLKGFVNPRNREHKGTGAFNPISRRQKCSL